LNDRAAGAIEALAWVRTLLEGADNVAKIRREVETVRDELLHGVAVDFRERLKIR
jgi:hypothetical protein